MTSNLSSEQGHGPVPAPKPKDLGHVKLLYCGFISGLVQAGTANPDVVV